MQEIFLLLAITQGCGMPPASPVRRAELLVSVESLAVRLRDPGLVILHLDMTRDRYRSGHIPGARWVDPHAFTATAHDGIALELPTLAVVDSLIEAAGISNDSRVVLYGDPGHLGRAFLALEHAGLAGRVAVLNGGLDAWRAAGQPMATDVPRPVKASFTPRPDPGIVIGTDELRARLTDRQLALIDTRSTDEYERGGHIPGARLLDWSRTFMRPEAASNGGESLLVSDAALLRMFRDAGAETDRDLVLYCTIGLRASHMYFVARYLGFNPRLYDRSIEAWRRRPDLPIKTGARP